MVYRVGEERQGSERKLNGYRGSTRNAESISLAFSELNTETGQPKEFALSGYVFALGGMTDKPGEMLIAFDRPDSFARIAPGWQSPPRDDPFATIWLKRALSTPARSDLFFRLTSSWDRDFKEGPIAPRALAGGASNFLAPGKTLVTVLQDSILAPQLLLAPDSGRTIARVRNVSPGSEVIWITLDGATVGQDDDSPGVIAELAEGEMVEVAFTGGIYAFASLATAVALPYGLIA